MELSREQLYERIWSDGIGKTEQALGLRRDELLNICETFNIPRPSSSYWSALKYGKSAKREELPIIKDNRVIRTDDFIKDRIVKKPKPAPAQQVTEEGKYEPKELLPEEPPTIYTVPEKLLAKDPVLLDTKAKLREKNIRDNNPWSKKNPYKSTPQKWLDIQVSTEQEDRAIRIFSTIWKAATANGYQLKIIKNNRQFTSDCTTFITVREHDIRVYIKEINMQVRKEDGSRDPSRLVGSGRLKFLCNPDPNFSSWDERCLAQDTQQTLLEDKIERIIQKLSNVADDIEREEEERKQAEERRRQEEERKRKEAEEKARIKALKDAERTRTWELLFNAGRLHAATKIRNYAKQFEKAMAGTTDEDALRGHLKWMLEKADFIDPLNKHEDDLLDEDDIDILLQPEIINTTQSASNNYYGGFSQTYSYWQIKNIWGKD